MLLVSAPVPGPGISCSGPRLTPTADIAAAASGAAGHVASASPSAANSSEVIARPYAALTSTCCTAYAQWYPWFGGNHREASEALLSWLGAADVGTRFAGSFANSRASAEGQSAAPLRQASASATTWSICTWALVAGPRTKSTRCPV